MSSTPVSLTQKWLKQNTAFYTSPDRVYSDADAVLSRYTTLRPKTDVYSTDLVSSLSAVLSTLCLLLVFA